MKRIKNMLQQQKPMSFLIVAIIAITYYIILENFGNITSGLDNLIGVLSPIITGLFIAFLLSPFANFFERILIKKIKKSGIVNLISVSLTFVISILFVIVMFLMIIPQLYQTLRSLIPVLNEYFLKLPVYFEQLNKIFPEANIDPNIIAGKGQELSAALGDLLADNPNTILDFSIGLGNKMLNFILGLFLSMYLVADRHHITISLHRIMRALVNNCKHDRVLEISTRVYSTFTKFIVSNLFDSLIIGIANYIFLLAMGIKYELLIAIIAGVLNFIPTFGPIIAFILSFTIIAATDFSHATFFLIFTIILQTLDANVIKPRLFSSSVGLRPALTLIAIIVSGKLFGLWGMILGVPLFGVIIWLFNEYISMKTKKKVVECENAKKEQ